MKKPMVSWSLILVAAGCSSSPAPVAAIPVDPRCEAISDTLAKYVSSDALPPATYSGETAGLKKEAPATVVSVDFLVGPDGRADPSTVEVIGGSSSSYDQAVAAFAAKNRFVPGQVNGCNVESRFTLVLR